MIVAVSMVRDEADIIETTIRHMARHVDQLIVADNRSTDGTREILDQLAQVLPLEVLDDAEPGYYQSRKMTGLAELAAARGATWVVPFDADEIWLPRVRGSIAQVLSALPAHVLIAEAQLFDHVATGLDDEHQVDPVARLQWRRTAAAPLRKVAVRPLEGLTIHQGNHAATFPGLAHPPAVTNALEVRHFPYRSVEQFARKVRNGAAAYAATDLPASAGGHWRSYGRILNERGEAGIAEIFHKWFWRDDPAQPIAIDTEQQAALVRDPAP